MKLMASAPSLCVVALATLLARQPVGAVDHRLHVSSLMSDSQSKKRPLSKVVRLLEDMRVELQRELDDDKKVHEMLSCWCETNNVEKTQAIQQSEQSSVSLQSSMDAATAKIVELKEKRKPTMDEINQNHAALGSASALRMKETKASHAEEADLVEAIQACKQALGVLSKHNPELAQLSAVANRLRRANVPKLIAASGGLAEQKMDVLKAFLHVDPAPSFLATPYQSYAPQSGQIFGILKQMQEDFEANLSEVQKAELKAQEDYVALKAAKGQELAAGKKAVVQFDADIADFSEKHVQAARELEDTQAQLALDKEFLENLKTKCSESQAEFDTRMRSRFDEIVAVEDTIKILNTDEAFQVFDKAVNIQFLQTTSLSSKEQRLRTRATVALQRAASFSARAGNSVQASMVLAFAQAGAFDKVNAEIDKLVAELGKQQEDEVAQRDWCHDELAKNDRDTAAADDKKTDLQSKITDLETSVEKLTTEIDAKKTTINETQTEMMRASQNREAENAGFQQTISDQRLTQTILQKAINRMKQVYALVQQQPGAAHIATSGTHTDAGNGPARFTKYEQNAGGSRIVAMLETVMADSKKMEGEALKSEDDAQSFYENFMKDSNKLITQNSESITNMAEACAKAKQSLVMSKDDLKRTVEQLGELSGMLGELHKSCDFVIENFEARQTARAAEMDSLREAKAILSGMK